ncbi:MAG: RlmE family RNA methyltransferase [Chloroflexota bacterium]
MSWRQNQSGDRFFRRARAEGYRARSAYKLIEIADTYRLPRPGQVVLDLGAAPGSWSQVALERVRPGGRVLAVDLQPIARLPGLETLVGDVREASTLEAIRGALAGPADLAMSDVAPNASGILVTDQARAIELASHALAIARAVLRPGGSFIVKVFRGEDFDRFLGDVRHAFKKVNVVIPKATRVESREAYVVARGMQGGI